MILFLDDCVSRQKQFALRYPNAHIVDTAAKAIAALSKETYKVVCLDHDLGGEIYVESESADTGMEVARWIAKNKPEIDLVVVHTLNPDGGDNMMSMLKGYKAARIPFLIMFELESMKLIDNHNV